MKRWALLLVVLLPGGVIVAGLWWWFMGRKRSGRSRWASQAKRELCHELLVERVDAALRDLDKRGQPVVVTDGYRSNAEQDRLAAGGSLGSGGVTNARGGQSPHNFGMAADLAPMDAEGRPTWPEDPVVWGIIGDAIERAGLAWGGRWRTPDRPHAELIDWRTRTSRGAV